MSSFLECVAEYMYKNYSNRFDSTCMVFPNKRAPLFFKKYLKRLSSKTIWLPKFLTISELMQDLSKLLIADNVVLNAELYASYKAVTKTKEGFDQFYYWGEVLLSDFDDIDKYLVNAEDIFQNLSALKSYSTLFDYLSLEQKELVKQFWSGFESTKFSNHQKEFLGIWSMLHSVYLDFKNRLQNRGIGYEGMVYRDVADLMKVRGIREIDYETFAFVGFNALNQCEKTLFNYLKKQGKAIFFWDKDSFYMDNPLHEAGHFLRENIKLFPGVTLESKKITTSKEKDITYISVASEMAQGIEVTSFVNELIEKKHKNWEKTAIVLANEECLLPVIGSIPSGVEKLNITMGYPFKQTMTYNLISSVVRLKENERKDSDNELVFYYKDVLALLKNRIVTNIWREEVSGFEEWLVANNVIYVPKGKLPIKELETLIFVSGINSNQFFLNLLTFLEFVLDRYEEGENDLTKEFVYSAITEIRKLYNSMKRAGVQLGMDMSCSIVRQLIDGLKVPFEGEPLEGLQVMGLLETRCLDFDHLIILSVNEGILPKTATAVSFIPYNLRKGFGLLTIERQDSIFAYYFYRLLQTAQTIRLSYVLGSSGSENKGEMSRFLYQLAFEAPFEIKKKNIELSARSLRSKQIEIPCDKEVMGVMSKFFQEGEGGKFLSPSALNIYQLCPLRFYYRYVAMIKEPDKVAEEMEPAMFGNILHKTMQLLYSTFLHEEISSEYIKKLIFDKKHIKEALERAFYEELLKDGETKRLQGYYAFIGEVIEKYVVQLLVLDEKEAPFMIKSLEHTYEMTVPITNIYGKMNVRIGGNIDRIDKRGGIIRILDYKTGKAETKFESIEGLFTKNAKKQNKAVFQLFVYSMLYRANCMSGDCLMPGLIVTKDLFSKSYDWRIYKQLSVRKYEEISDIQIYMKEFYAYFVALLEEMFSPDIPFSQTDDKEQCKNCPYNILCNI